MPGQKVTLKTVPDTHGLGVREKVAGPAGIGEVLADGFAALQRVGAMVAAAPVAVYHDPHFCLECIDVEVVFPVSAWVKGPVATPRGRTLEPRTVPGGRVAAVAHVGGFASISDSYDALAAWVEEYGYRVSGPPRELYLSLLADPEPALTEVRLPVEQVT
jgi:effector-binding domain-containing protein